jgi:chorismate mutase/prephenate dehydrogenase
VPSNLEDLRRRIAEADAALVDLVATRLALAREVGEVKRGRGLPVRSYATESEVLTRFRELAGDAGLDDRLAERLALLLISEAVRTQETAAEGRSGPGRRILLVGGAGKLGRWFADFFASQGHAVAILDPAGSVAPFATPTSLAAGVHGADVVLVTTPLAAGREVLREILALEPRGLVADAFSLKSHVLDLLQDAATRRRLRVASLHPLFGPEVRTLAGRIVAVCDCGNPSAADEAAALFSETALTISRLPLARHDELMQYVLGLSHLTAILFFTTLARSGGSFADLSLAASTTFWKQARTAAEVARESPTLYFEIQRLNRHSAGLFERVQASLAEIERAALADDPQEFIAVMRRGREFFPESLPAELA